MIRRQGTPGPVVTPLQRALRFVQDLGLGPRRRAPAKNAALRRVATARGSAGNDLLAGLELERDACDREIGRLQAELERLHDRVTCGLSAGASPGSTRKENLEQLVEQSRRGRELLQEKRLDLVRIDRNIARERLLRGEARRPKAAPTRTPPPAMGNDGEDLVRRRAIAKALRDSRVGDAPEHRAVKRWALALLDVDPAKRREAVSRIAQAPHPTWPLLQVAAEDPDQRVRLAAINGLSLGKGRGMADCLRRFVRDPHESVRVAALRGLARLDSRLPSIAELEAALEDSEPVVRKAAVELCAPRPEGSDVPPALLSALSFALRDDDVSVRLAAVQALRAGRDGRGVAALIRAVGDQSAEVSAAAFDALCAVEPRAADVAGAGLPPEERSRVLKIWWRDARVDDGSGTADSGALAAAAREAAVELTHAEDRRRAASAPQAPAPKPPTTAPAAARVDAPAASVSPSPEAAPARAPVAAAVVARAEPEPVPVPVPEPAPEPAPEAAADEFESILGDESAEAASADEAEGAAEDKDDFESVFDEGAENGEDEEYEKVLGEDKG